MSDDDADDRVHCDEPMTWDPEARGTSVGGLALVGALVCKCDAMGFRPDRICEPAVKAMGEGLRLATGASKGAPVVAALDATEDRFQARLAAYREETAALSSPRVEPAPRPEQERGDACSDCPCSAHCKDNGCMGPDPLVIPDTEAP